MNPTKEITSTPNNSLTTIVTVSHEPNLNTKIESSNTVIHGETSNDGAQLNDSVFLNTNEQTAEEIDRKTSVVSSLCLKNVTDLKKVKELYEDKMYGEYVTERLKYIENETVKQRIKLEIDHLFYSKLKKMFIDKL